MTTRPAGIVLALACLLAAPLLAQQQSGPGSFTTGSESVLNPDGTRTQTTTSVLQGGRRRIVTVERLDFSIEGAFVAGRFMRTIECSGMMRKLVQEGIIVEDEDGVRIVRAQETGSSLGIKVSITVVVRSARENGLPVVTTVRTPNQGSDLADLAAIDKRTYNLDGSITVRIWYDPSADPQITKPDDEYTIYPSEEADMHCQSNPEYNPDEMTTPPRALPSGSTGATAFGGGAGFPNPDPTLISP